MSERTHTVSKVVRSDIADVSFGLSEIRTSWYYVRFDEYTSAAYSPAVASFEEHMLPIVVCGL